MSRAIEKYVCSSEDRVHYNTDNIFLHGFHYGMRAPHIMTIKIVNKVINKVIAFLG